MQNIELKYESFTGITKIFFPEIKAVIKNDTITVESEGKKASLKVVYKPVTYTNKDYIYHLKKTQLNLCQKEGIKFLIDAQPKGSLFFNSARSILQSILKKT